jgi:hypothetical protein
MLTKFNLLLNGYTIQKLSLTAEQLLWFTQRIAEDCTPEMWVANDKDQESGDDAWYIEAVLDGRPIRVEAVPKCRPNVVFFIAGDTKSQEVIGHLVGKKVDDLVVINYPLDDAPHLDAFPGKQADVFVPDAAHRHGRGRYSRN